MDENLKVYQDKEHFRFNTDTKLLAQFVRLKAGAHFRYWYQ